MPVNDAFDGYQSRELEQRPVSRSSNNLTTQNCSVLPGHPMPVATEVTHLKSKAKQAYLSDTKVQIPEVETVSLFLTYFKNLY